MARKGLPKKYIKQYGISKKAWREYRKAKKRGSRRRSSSRRKTKKGGRKVGKRKMSIPLAVVAPIVGNFAKPAPSGRSLVQDLMNGDINGFLYDFREVFGGIDANGNIKFDWLLNTYGPILAGALIHKFVGGSPLNLNRTLAAAGVPLIRI